MPIELVTGLPGSGKTLQTIWRIKARAEKEDRPVYYSGIAELTLPWIEWDPKRWMDLPAGAIMVIDEAQRLYRPRGRTGEPPDYVHMLETHRHLGIDLVFITQSPMLIDSHVRNLCERHWHVMRKFGTQFATIYEYPTGVRTSVASNRGKDGIRHEFRYPKEVFTYYKSAELHTVKRRIPAKVWVMLAMPFVFGAAAFTAYMRLNPDAQREQAEKAVFGAQGAPGAASAPAPGVMQARRVGADGKAILSTEDYLARQVPRVAGLVHTAPVFDEVTRPTEAPYPAACIASAAKCVCASQQGTRLEVPDELCRSIAAGGFFVAWGRPAAKAVPIQGGQAGAVAVADSAVPAGPGSLGGTGYGLAARPGAVPAVTGGVPGDQQQPARPRAPQGRT